MVWRSNNKHRGDELLLRHSTSSAGAANLAVAASRADLEKHYHGGNVTNLGLTLSLTKSRSFGRDRAIKGMPRQTQQVNNTMTTKIKTTAEPVIELHHDPPPAAAPQHVKSRSKSTGAADKRQNWFIGGVGSGIMGGRAKGETKMTAADANLQTPNHKLSAGRAFADRMMRTVSPTKKRQQERDAARYIPTQQSRKAVVVARDDQDAARRSRRRAPVVGSSISSSIGTTTGTLHASDLDRRIARIERALFESEQRDQQQQGHWGGIGGNYNRERPRPLPPPPPPPSRHRIDLTHNPNFPPEGRSPLSPTPESRRRRAPPPSLTNRDGTPTLFASTKRMMHDEEQSWPTAAAPPPPTIQGNDDDDADDDDDDGRDKDDLEYQSSMSGSGRSRENRSSNANLVKDPKQLQQQQQSSSLTSKQWKKLKKSSRQREQQKHQHQQPPQYLQGRSSSALVTPIPPPPAPPRPPMTNATTVAPLAIRAVPVTPSPQPPQQQSTPRASNVGTTTSNSNDTLGMENSIVADQDEAENVAKVRAADPVVGVVDPVQQFRSTYQNEKDVVVEGNGGGGGNDGIVARPAGLRDNLLYVLSDLSASSAGMDASTTEEPSIAQPSLPHPTLACFMPNPATSNGRDGMMCAPKIHCHNATSGRHDTHSIAEQTTNSSIQVGDIPKEVVATMMMPALGEEGESALRGIITEDDEEEDVGINKNEEAVHNTTAPTTVVQTTTMFSTPKITALKVNDSMEEERQLMMPPETRHPLHNESPMASSLLIDGHDEKEDRYLMYHENGDSFDEAARNRMRGTAKRLTMPNKRSVAPSATSSTRHRKSSETIVCTNSHQISRTKDRLVPRVSLRTGMKSPRSGDFSLEQRQMIAEQAHAKRQALQSESRSRSPYQRDRVLFPSRKAVSPRSVFQNSGNCHRLGTTRGNNLLQSSHPTIADDARLDERQLKGKCASRVGTIHDLKLSPYPSKQSGLIQMSMAAQSRESSGWFGWKNKSKDYNKETIRSDEEVHGATLHVTGSSVQSGITIEGDSTSCTPDDQIHPLLVFEQSKKHRALSTAHGQQSVLSSQLSLTNKSQKSDSIDPKQKDVGNLSNLHHATTFDDIIQDLKRFEKQLPHAEFAVVELGEDSDTIPTHSILMNKSDVEHELMMPGADDETMAVMSNNHTFMPYGLAPISDSNIEVLVQSANARAIDDMSMERLEVSESFADQINHLRQIQQREKKLAKKKKRPNRLHSAIKRRTAATPRG